MQLRVPKQTQTELHRKLRKPRKLQKMLRKPRPTKLRKL